MGGCNGVPDEGSWMGYHDVQSGCLYRRETGKCRFDSEPFKAVPEFVKRFPDSLETTKEEASLPAKIADGRILFAIADFHSLGNFQRYEGMFGETAACVGFPTPEGKGGTLLSPPNAFGITSMSQYKDGAWEFIESVQIHQFIGPDKRETYPLYLHHPRPGCYHAAQNGGRPQKIRKRYGNHQLRDIPGNCSHKRGRAWIPRRNTRDVESGTIPHTADG